MAATERSVAGVGRLVAVVVASAVLLGCSSTPPPPPAEPGTTGAITRVGDDFLEVAGDDIFSPGIAAGGGFVWRASLEGLIQVDPATMDATWHTDLAPGRALVYAFDSLWVGVSSGVVRVDPTSLEEIATIRLGAMPEGLAADEDSIWTSQHQSRVVLRIDPRTNKVVETIDVANPDSPVGGRPMVPSVVDGDIWVAMGLAAEVVRIDAARKVTRFALEREVTATAVATPEALWFSNLWILDRRVTRIDRATGVVSSAELPASALDSRPGQIGPGIYVDGTLWFLTTGGTMVAIDPVTFDVLGTVPLQGSVPRAVVEYDGAIWVASDFNASFERIPLERLAEGLAAGG
jgi:streptogramin lyase